MFFWLMQEDLKVATMISECKRYPTLNFFFFWLKGVSGVTKAV